MDLGFLRASARVCAALCLCLSVNGLAAAPPVPVRLAQVNGRQRGAFPAAAEGADSVFLRADRITLQRLARAEDAIAESQFDDAARYLGTILESSEDFFYRPDSAQPIFRSLKAEASRMVGGMARSGRESYELQYGATARELLGQAVDEGSMAKLADVSRRYFHTQAGFDATFLLGVWNLDHGQPLAAALCFERLRENSERAAELQPELSVRLAVCWLLAGMRDEAREELARLRQSQVAAQFEVAGNSIRLFDRDEQSLTWLAQSVGADAPLTTSDLADWTLVGGDAARNASSEASRPLLIHRWATPACEDSRIGDFIAEMRRSFAERGSFKVPSMQPLAVGDYVLMRSIKQLVAVDLRTGKRIWKGAVDEGVSEAIDLSSRGDMSTLYGQGSIWLGQRVWNDATYGTMSSDGQCVFCVEDVGTGMSMFSTPRTVVFPNGRRLEPEIGSHSYNRLTAYELATEGKLRWEVGGATGDGQLPLAGSYFLGPPLPLGGNLYVIAEVAGEVRLLALDAGTGELEWSQQLAQLDPNLSLASGRRNCGAAPSYADGVLVCPTSAGAVVALDLTTRSLLWGYEYSVPMELSPNAFGRFAMGYVGFSDEMAWIDATVTIADGHVLITPRESDELHCLDLRSGRVLWRKPREDGLYVACVAGQTAMVVGAASLRGFQLDDGEPAWSAASFDLPKGATPSGRGYFDGQHYFLPLAPAEVATIDTLTGKIVERARSHSGDTPGNLICYKGQVISQSPESVECFSQIENLRGQVDDRLTANPNDPVGLALSGELRFEAGEFEAAADALRRSYEDRPAPRTRELLVDAMIAAVESNFSAHRSAAKELEHLIDDPLRRLDFLRAIASGLHELGETMPAFEAYMRIVDAAMDGPRMTKARDERSVRLDRWVANNIASLRDAADANEKNEIDSRIATLLATLVEKGDVQALDQHLRYFDPLAAVDVARESLAARWIEEDHLIEAEGLLRRLATSSDERLAARANARLAEIFISVADLDAAEMHLETLASRYANVACADGKTGTEIAREFRTLLPQAEVSGHHWPQGLVKIAEDTSSPTPVTRIFPIELRGSASPYFADLTFEFDQQRYTVVARDSLGRVRWAAPLAERSNDRVAQQLGMAPQMITFARVVGHVMLLSAGTQLIAIDTLGTRASRSARVMWRHDLVDAIPGAPRSFFVNQQTALVPWGQTRVIPIDARQRPIGNLTVAGDLTVFERGRGMIAVDTISGEVVWTRDDVEGGSDLHGDSEIVFATPFDSTEARVYRASDGAEVGHRDVPPAARRMTALGRRLATWSTEGARSTVGLVDPWSGETLWQKSFAHSAKPWLIGDEAVAVLEEEGRFVVLSLVDGQATIDAKVDAEPNLGAIHVLRTPDMDLLLTSRQSNGRASRSVTAMYGHMLLRGLLHGFDRETGARLYTTKLDDELRGLSLTQPADSPLLVFASTVTELNRVTGAQRGAGQKLALRCVDKRTGRVVYDHEMGITTQINLEVLADPTKNTVKLGTTRASIELTLTDEPIPEAPTVEEPKTGAASAAAGAILRALGRPAGLIDPAEGPSHNEP